MHTDLRTLKVKECEAQYCSHIDSNCCRPAEDTLTIRLPPSEPPIVDLFKMSIKPSIYVLKSCGDRTPP